MKNENYNTVKPLAVVASNMHAEGIDFAKNFAEHGYDLIVAAKNPSVVEEAQELQEMGVDAVSFQLDLATDQGVEELYRRIVATGRPVEAVLMKPEMTELAKKILKDMAMRGHGRILFSTDGNEEELNEAWEAISQQAEGTGVTITAVKTGEKELFFLKEGFEEPTLLH